MSAKGSTEAIQQPNIIIFYVDDLGWQDSQLNDIDEPTPWETPNMLALAKKGMNFTQGYSAAPTCAPSRAGILSGQHPAKLQFTHVSGAGIPEASTKSQMIAPYFNDHFQPDTLTLADALKANGYKTGHVGKWHLGNYADVGPLTVGFDYSYGGRGAHRNSKDRSKDFASRAAKDKYRLSDEKYFPYSKNHPNGISYPYDLVTENALGFIKDSVEDNKEKPFFLYLAHWMVHYPTVTKNRNLLEYYTDKLGIEFPKKPSNVTTPGQTNPYYGAMVTTVDWSLGRLVSLLENTDDPRHPGKKLIDTTYIFLTSDNGGAENRGTEIFTDNAPLDMGKKHPQEGGIRVPMVITGPTVKENATNHHLINQLDFFPTILNLTNSAIAITDKEKLSGLDITQVISGENPQATNSDGKARENLFWHFPHNDDDVMQSALREGDFKLYKNHKDGSYELYRLYQDGKRADLEEKFDLAKSSHFTKTMAELVINLESHLIDNNAQYPHFNPSYQNDLPGKSEVAVIISSKFDASNRVAQIKLSKSKTQIAQAYVLGQIVRHKLSENSDKLGKKVITYKKLPAQISKDSLSVSAKIPKQFSQYLFVIIDNNNFLVKTKINKTKAK